MFNLIILFFIKLMVCGVSGGFGVCVLFCVGEGNDYVFDFVVILY